MEFRPNVGTFVFGGEHGWSKWPGIVVLTSTRASQKVYHVKYLGQNINSCSTLTFDKLQPFEWGLKLIGTINSDDLDKSYFLMAISVANH
jgi:hypothetical protein